MIQMITAYAPARAREESRRLFVLLLFYFRPLLDGPSLNEWKQR